MPSERSPTGLETRYEYDFAERLVKVIELSDDPNEADVQIDITRDHMGLPTTISYAAMDVAMPRTESWSYDGFGRQISSIDARGTTREYLYDWQSRLVQTHIPSAPSLFKVVREFGPHDRVSKENFHNLGIRPADHVLVELRRVS